MSGGSHGVSLSKRLFGSQPGDQKFRSYAVQEIRSLGLFCCCLRMKADGLLFGLQPRVQELKRSGVS